MLLRPVNPKVIQSGSSELYKAHRTLKEYDCALRKSNTNAIFPIRKDPADTTSLRARLRELCRKLYSPPASLTAASQTPVVL